MSSKAHPIITAIKKKLTSFRIQTQVFNTFSKYERPMYSKSRRYTYDIRATIIYAYPFTCTVYIHTTCSRASCKYLHTERKETKIPQAENVQTQRIAIYQR